jgi:hypothetical protein
MGVAYFWAHAYKHALRDASAYRRTLAHRLIIEAGLEPNGESEAHTEIMRRVFPKMGF